MSDWHLMRSLVTFYLKPARYIMENLLDDYRQQTPPLSDQEIFTRIWTSPRSVFRYLHTYQYDKYVSLLLILAGIAKGFDQAATKNMGDSSSLPVIIGICVVVGGLFGWITYYFYAGLLSWTGKWIKGTATTKEILRVIAYGMLPSIISLVFVVIQIIVYGEEIFKKEGNIIRGSTIEDAVFYISLLWQFTLVIWTMILIVVGISEVQKFSIGKAILNLLFPGFVIMIPIGLIVLLVFLLKS
jgi:hypothetical protein